MCEKVACLRQGLRVVASGSVRCRVTMIDPVLFVTSWQGWKPASSYSGRKEGIIQLIDLQRRL